MKKISTVYCLITVLILAAVIVSTAAVSADIKLQVKAMANRIERLLTPQFISGYHLISSGKVEEKGKGQFGGDVSVSRVYFSKSKNEYDTLVKQNKLTQSNDTRLVIYVDVFDTPADAQKKAASRGLTAGTFTGSAIGDLAWHGGLPKKTVEMVRREEAAKKPAVVETPAKRLSPSEMKKKAQEDKQKQEAQIKADAELAKKLDEDPQNFNFKTLVVVYKHFHIHISSINYKAEPEGAVLELVVQQIISKL